MCVYVYSHFYEGVKLTVKHLTMSSFYLECCEYVGILQNLTRGWQEWGWDHTYIYIYIKPILSTRQFEEAFREGTN